ncbi:MAG: methionyl-tRNA formyltransferase [Steroidobacteraceae bacterium]
MRIVYAGTPEFAVPALAALCGSSHQVLAVYTQPDRPAGRGRFLTASPVKAYALAHGLPVEQPVNFRDAAQVGRLRSYAPDALVVAAYGLILPQAVLDIPRYGCINIHASLLPRWRGAAPIQRALLAGDAETGVTIMRMEAGLDTGPMLRKQGFAITAQDTAATLHDRLADLGATLLLAVLNDLPETLASAQRQPEAGVTYAKKLSKAEALLDWSLPATQLERQVRAFIPWPIAETRLHGEQLRVWQASVVDAAHHAVPGTVLNASAAGIQVACGTGILNLVQVQQAGRKMLAASDFIKSHSLPGVQLGVTTGTVS